MMVNHHGTAGAPMLNIIVKNNISNILIVVTRYFGGILLGTGGLVKAYSEAAQKALSEAEFVYQAIGYEVEVQLPYSELESFKYFCKQENIKITKEDYAEQVKLSIEILEKNKSIQLEKITSDKFKNLSTKVTLTRQKTETFTTALRNLKVMENSQTEILKTQEMVSELKTMRKKKTLLISHFGNQQTLASHFGNLLLEKEDLAGILNALQ